MLIALLHWLLSTGDMLDLLKWRAHPDKISDSLTKLKEIDGSEIVKVDYTALSHSIYFKLSVCFFSFSPTSFSSLTKREHYSPVLTGYTGHSLWHVRREPTEIRTQSV